LLSRWILHWLSFLDMTDERPHGGLIAAGLCGAAWTVAYAVVDAAQSSRAHVYDLHVRWLAIVRRVFQPAGWRDFLRAAGAAVPLNVVLTFLASVGVGVLGYVYLGGSEGRDRTFRLAFTLLTGLAVGAYLAGERRRARSKSSVD
jgi:hypothetical protein